MRFVALCRQKRPDPARNDTPEGGAAAAAGQVVPFDAARDAHLPARLVSTFCEAGYDVELTRYAPVVHSRREAE